MSDLPAIHRAITEAQERGDPAAANAAYALELQELARQPQASTAVAPATAGVPAERVEEVFDYLASEFDQDSADRLRAAWGGRAGEKLALAVAFSSDHPGLVSISEKWGLADHPVLLELAAQLAGELGYSLGTNPRTATAGPGSPRVDEGFAAGMRSFTERIEAARGAGNSRLANQLYQEQQAWIASVQGNQPIVGRLGRTA
jgi:hypothetical protein